MLERFTFESGLIFLSYKKGTAGQRVAVAARRNGAHKKTNPSDS